MAIASLGPRVLIVEDHAETADLLGRYARLLQCDTQISHTGSDALQQAAEFLPQIILLDIGVREAVGWVSPTMRTEPFGNSWWAMPTLRPD